MEFGPNWFKCLYLWFFDVHVVIDGSLECFGYVLRLSLNKKLYMKLYRVVNYGYVIMGASRFSELCL
jgi:hypothetical protein